MPRYRKEDWTYYHRKTKDGIKVLYYRTYSNGKRTAGRSTGTTEKTKADRYVRRLERTGKLVPIKMVAFEKFTENFMIWGKCEYIAFCKIDGKRNVSMDHARIARCTFDKHVLPFFKAKNLSDVTEEDIKAFLVHLRTTTKLKDGSINHALKIAKIVFKEAVRRKVILADPSAGVKCGSDNHRTRGILELSEIRALLNPSPETIKNIWGDNRIAHAFNYLAATTGCRRGELIALKPKDVHPDYVDISHSWGRKEGVKDTTKNGEPRLVPIPSMTYDVVKNIMPADNNSFVFSFDGGNTPYSERMILPHLYLALGKIGITEQIRVARNICFHSWRHFFNTHLLVNDVSETKVREAIGHKTAKMTQKYAHLVLKNLKAVLDAQETIIQKGNENGKAVTADQE